MKRLVGALLGIGMLAGQASAAPIVLGTYYEETVSGACTNPAGYECFATFSHAPTGKRVTNKSIDCQYRMEELFISRATLSTGTNFAERPRGFVINLTQDDVGNGVREYVSEYKTPFLFGDNSFRVRVEGGAADALDAIPTISFSCTLVGELSNR